MLKIIRTSTIPLSLNLLLKGQLRYLNRRFDVKALSGDGGDLQEVKEREGVEVVACRMVRQISLFQDIKSLVNLFRIFKQEKPVIVHSITPKAGLLSMLAAKLAGVPIRIHTFTGLIFPTRKGFMQKLLIKMDQLLCWAATDVYPEGIGVKNDLISYKITNKPLKVLANGNVNGIDLNYYAPQQVTATQRKLLRDQLKIADNDFVFIFIGRLVGDKGINELVEAFDTINRSKAKLLLVGSFEVDFDPLKAATLERIASNPAIICMGFQSDVRPFFAISHALAFASYREGFPNVVIQAGAMALPSIVTDINGCNEIIEDGKNGCFVPVGDVQALRTAMIRLIDDCDFYESLQKYARNAIVTRYDQNLVWKAIEEEYFSLLSKEGVCGNV